MTRKQAIAYLKREGIIIPEGAVEQAISDMQKLVKIEQIVNKWNEVNHYDCGSALRNIQEVLESEVIKHE